MKVTVLVLLAGLLCLYAPSRASAEDMCNINFVPSRPWKQSCHNHFWSHCDGNDFSCETFHASCEYDTIYHETFYGDTEVNCEKVKQCKGKLKNKNGKLVCN